MMKPQQPQQVRSKAFLVARFDVGRTKPTLRSMGIFSEAEPTLAYRVHRNVWQTVVLEAEGHNYESAYQKVVEQALKSPYFAWTRPYVKQIQAHDARIRQTMREQGFVVRSFTALGCPACDGQLVRVPRSAAHNVYRCGVCGAVWRMPQQRQTQR